MANLGMIEQLEIVARTEASEVLPARFGVHMDKRALAGNFLKYDEAEIAGHVDRIVSLVSNDTILQCPCCPESLSATSLKAHCDEHKAAGQLRPFLGLAAQGALLSESIGRGPTIGQIEERIRRAQALSTSPETLEQAIHLLQMAARDYPPHRRRLSRALEEWQARLASLRPRPESPGHGLSLTTPVLCESSARLHEYLDAIMCPWGEPCYWAPAAVHAAVGIHHTEEYDVRCTCGQHSLRLFVAIGKTECVRPPGSAGWTLGRGLPLHAKAKQYQALALWEAICSDGGTCSRCDHKGEADADFRVSLGRGGISVLCQHCGHPQASD